MPDHIHLFISALPTIAPTEIVKILKSVSANEIFKGNKVLGVKVTI